MDYLDFAKSTLSKALGPQQPSVNFTVGQMSPFQAPQSLFKLYDGTKKDDSSQISVFVFEIKKGDKTGLLLARNALKKTMTLRFPGMLTYIDGAETPSRIIIGTEKVESFSTFFGKSRDSMLTKFGVYRVAATLYSLQESNIVHGNLNLESIFVTKAGEFKLGCLEYASSMTEEQPILASTGHTFPPSAIHIPPEITALSWNQFKSLPVNSFDSWGFGVLLYRIFNSEPIDQQSLTTLGNIPPTLSKLYKALLNPAPTSRISLAKFLEYATKQGAYFDDDFVNATIFLDEIALKSDTEKNAFVNSIGGFMDRFPLEFCKFKILPELLKALEFSGLGPSALKAALDIGARLDSVEFGQIIKPVALKLFASSDRAIRMALCENISSYVEHLTTDDIKNSVYDHLVTGFQDSNPRVREQTLKAITVIAPKLNSKTLNNSLLRFLAKLQTDPEPGIRTNTLVCLVKVSGFINESVRSKVLSSAFIKGLHDPFTFAKNAALIGMSASCAIFSPEEVATRLLPSICPLLIHPDKTIRTQSKATMLLYTKRLEDSAAKGDFDVKIPDASEPPGENSGSGSTWTNWAISTVSNSIISNSTSKPGSASSSAADLTSIPVMQPSVTTEANSTNFSNSYAKSSAPTRTQNTSAPITSKPQRQSRPMVLQKGPATVDIDSMINNPKSPTPTVLNVADTWEDW